MHFLHLFHRFLNSIDFAFHFFDFVFHFSLIGLNQVDFVLDSVDFVLDSIDFVLIIFLIASILLQVVILNMIIAIMGDTFDRIIEQQQRYKIGVCPDIYADFFQILNIPKDLENYKYLYVLNF
jgi:hypothetical protein